MYVISYHDTPTGAANGIFVFSTTASGNVAPVRTITSSASQLFGPFDAVDSSGNVYADQFNNQGNDEAVYVYPAGANGNVAPARGITYDAPGGVLGYFRPEGLAIDNARHELYVYDYNVPGIEVFSLGTTGSSTPIRVISGSNTNIVPVAGNNSGIAFNSVSGDLYVESRSGILVFPQGSSGNVAPSRSITTSAYAEFGLAVGPLTQDLFESTGNLTVNVYSPAASGNATALRVVAGGNTGIVYPGGLAVDSAENVYLANTTSGNGTFAPCIFGGYNYGEILIWGAQATGNVAPARTLCGPNTGFSAPEAVAIGS
jgi:hypothetical protein